MKDCGGGGRDSGTRLGLNWVEVAELAAVERLEGRVAQRADGQRLQVQQLSGRRILLGQDEVPEGQRQRRLALRGDWEKASIVGVNVVSVTFRAR